jgi:hypothetical protein
MCLAYEITIVADSKRVAMLQYLYIDEQQGHRCTSDLLRVPEAMCPCKGSSLRCGHERCYMNMQYFEEGDTSLGDMVFSF